MAFLTSDEQTIGQVHHKYPISPCCDIEVQSYSFRKTCNSLNCSVSTIQEFRINFRSP